MSMEPGRAWVETELNVSRATLARLDAFAAYLAAENEDQNLVLRATLSEVWTRHIWDSAQLLKLAENPRPWIDLGTGAGFPGLVVAALTDAQVTMVEARPRRVDSRRRAAELLMQPASTEIVCAKVERVTPRRYDVIS